VKFGGGKTIRDGMAQSQRTRLEGAVDCVMTNALISTTGASSRPTSA
jgi:urease subunit alpha